MIVQPTDQNAASATSFQSILLWKNMVDYTQAYKTSGNLSSIGRYEGKHDRTHFREINLLIIF